MIKPIYTEIHPYTGRPLHLLYADDYEKVRQGYGCSYCLEDYNGVWMPQCPVCRHISDYGGGDFIGVPPPHMIPEDMSLIGRPQESDYFEQVKSAS